MGWIALVAEPAWPTRSWSPPLIVAGVGISMAFPAAQNSVVGAVPPEAIGKASGTQQHDARARRRVRHRGRRGGVRRRGRLRVAGAFTDGFAPAIAVSAGLSFAAAGAGRAALPVRARESARGAGFAALETTGRS